MEYYYMFDNISINFVGSQKCTPGHNFSVGFSNKYLIHYIVSGKGKFVRNGKTYHLEKGSAFFIIDETGGYYEADKDDPWYYIWFNISGGMADYFLRSVGVSPDNPIYTTDNPEAIARQLEQIVELDESNNEFLVCGAVISLLGTMIKYNQNTVAPIKIPSSEYVKTCKEYVKMNLHNKVSVDDLCRCAGLEHSYLYRLFKKEINMSPVEYIINCKLEYAKNLLADTSLSVGDISSAVGYDDRFAFSKQFKKKYGLSPLKFRKNP